MSRATPAPDGPLLQRTHNILVMGVDHRPWDPNPEWHTDTMMVLAIDKEGGRVGVVSIPRDLYLDVPGLGKARINQVDYYGESTGYPGGGPALVRRVLTETFNLPTQAFVRIQMDGLVRLVDALGGVTVMLDCPLYERFPDARSPNGVQDWNLPAGDVFLNGETAKKFATARYATTDFGRARRQQQLIWAIRDRALQIDAVPRIPGLWSALRDSFTTDLGLTDALELARMGAGLQPGNVRGLVWNTDVLEYYWTEEGASVLVVRDAAKMQEQLAHLFDAQPLATLGQTQKSSAGGCPPPPTPVPTFTPRPVVTATIAITATAVVTATSTVAAAPGEVTGSTIAAEATPGAPPVPAEPPPATAAQPPETRVPEPAETPQPQ